MIFNLNVKNVKYFLISKDNCRVTLSPSEEIVHPCNNAKIADCFANRVLQQECIVNGSGYFASLYIFSHFYVPRF